LPRLGDLLSREGLSFTNAFATNPVCAPSRVSILTGRYSHNHGAYLNGIGFTQFRETGGESSTIATWLRAAGYRTALFGKYLNGYPEPANPAYIPPGWDEWRVHLTSYRDDRYHTYTRNENGVLVDYGRRPEEYDTDVLARDGVAFIRRAAAEPERPFFLLLSTQAPHSPAVSAERHLGEFHRTEAPRPPSFNEADVRDKPAWVRNRVLLDAAAERRVDELYVGRLRSMLAVEDLVEQVLLVLAETGRLGTTYLLFTSDNGLQLGEHRLIDQKGCPYEESIRVPLVVRGPGIAPGRSLDHVALNIDLAPTFAALAGLPPPETVDGQSLVPLFGERPPGTGDWRADALFETHGYDWSIGLRTRDYMFAEHDTGEREIYDMRTDPFQTDSQHRTTDPALIETLARRTQTLFACRGVTCSR
jgi:arylsulfatase A-like enzyme